MNTENNPAPSRAARRSGRVVVVGSSNTDLVVHCPRLPFPGETVLGRDLLTFAGGKGANQAVAAARAGAKVVFAGAFGDDAFGRARRADLEKEGVDCSACVTKKGVSSGVALIGIGSRHAENLIMVAPGANARLTPADVRKALRRLGPQDVLLLSLEIPPASVYAAAAEAAAAGACVVLNPAPFPAGGLPRRLWRCVRLATPNETEFKQLGPVSRRLAERDKISFIVTCGAAGARWLAPGRGPETYPAPRVKAVDTVGAGDCFNGCLAAELARGCGGISDALRFALAGAALKVTRAGAQAGMPRRAEILRFSGARKTR